MKKVIFLLVSFFYCLSYSHTQPADNLDLQFFQAYSLNSVPLWLDGINKLKQQTKAKPSASKKLELAKACYGSATAYMVNDNKDLAKDMLAQADLFLDELLEMEEHNAEAHALQSGVYGLQIALSPMKGMMLGGSSKSQIQKAIQLNPESAFTQLMMGNYLYYTPSMFGGDVEKSILHLEKAKQYYEASPNKMTWEYLFSLALLGQAYHQQEQLEAAQSTYTTALAVSPSFGWVKRNLQPALEKDMRNK